MNCTAVHLSGHSLRYSNTRATPSDQPARGTNSNCYAFIRLASTLLLQAALPCACKNPTSESGSRAQVTLLVPWKLAQLNTVIANHTRVHLRAPDSFLRRGAVPGKLSSCAEIPNGYGALTPLIVERVVAGLNRSCCNKA